MIRPQIRGVFPERPLVEADPHACNRGRLRNAGREARLLSRPITAAVLIPALELAAGHYASSMQNAGLGKVLRYGAHSLEVVERLKWMETELYPAQKTAIEFLGKVELEATVA